MKNIKNNFKCTSLGRLILYVFLILFFKEIHAQTGPGGVGRNDGTSDLIIWYRPGNGISTTGVLVDSWANSAGVVAFDMSETAGQRPTLVTGVINGYNEVSFNGSNRLRTGLTLTTSNFITNQASSYVVSRAGNTTQTSSVYTTDPLVSNTRFQAHIPWANRVYFDIGRCCGAAARIQVGGLTGLGNYSIFSYDANPSTGKQLYRNQTLLQDRANTSTYNSHASQRFNLGGNSSGVSGFVGDIAEIAIYKVKRTIVERIIIDNYLAAKYNQVLTANDFYNEDTSGGNFDHKVAGIGQAIDGTNHTNSQGTGIVKIEAPSDLQNNEYLFWGEDQINSNYTFSTVAPANKRYRVNTKWRVSETGDVGTVTFSINETDVDFSGVPVGIFKLVRSTVSDFSTIVEEYDLALSGGTYSAAVSFDDNDYFTLEMVPTVDLSITKTVDKALPKVGDVIIFTLSLTNNGPQDATGVIIRDKLPSGLTYESGSSSILTGTYDDTSGDWTIGVPVIAGDPPITIQIGARVTSSGIITNTSQVISINQEDIDSTPGNDK